MRLNETWNIKLTDCKNIWYHERAYNIYNRLSDYFDFPSPIQVIAVLDCQTTSESRRQNIGISLKAHFKRFVSEKILKNRKKL